MLKMSSLARAFSEWGIDLLFGFGKILGSVYPRLLMSTFIIQHLATETCLSGKSADFDSHQYGFYATSSW
jgi:hypothetical protein